MDQQHAKLMKSVVCGGMAGCAAKTMLAPLERARIMLQVGSGKTLASTLRAVVREEGAFGLWAGNTANLARIFPSRGIAFATNDMLNSKLDVRTAFSSFVVGGASGLCATAATYPLDVVRGRQAGELRGAGRHNFAAAMLVISREGSLYRGATPTLLGSIPFEGVRFGVVEILNTNDGRPMTKAAHGALAGLVASVLTFPNDTIRRLLQQKRTRVGYFDCAAQLYAEHGPTRFYRGLLPNLLKAVPSAAIQFSVFDFLKRRFDASLRSSA